MKVHHGRNAAVACSCLAAITLLPCAGAGTAALPLPACPGQSTYQVGVAEIDITPRYPVRLSGFGFRRKESEGVTQRIWAKALAIGGDREDPAILITVDNLGVPDDLVTEVAARLKKAGIRRERLAVTATHTHTAPMLKGVAPTLFGEPIPPQHQKHIDRYTRELADDLEKVARAALKDRAPARLTWGIGSVGFARNRRTKGGPVDHDLPVLVVKDFQGKIRAIYVSYACHCVTLSNNKISGDWAGYAQEMIRRSHPGAVALASVGCGADANPSSGVTGDQAEVAADQGLEISREVDRLLQGYLAPVAGKLTARLSRFDLPLNDLPTRAQWQERAKRGGAVGYHAKVQLARLDRSEALQTTVPYSVQSWTFGDQLAMVFLPGEVVVDYSLRLKRELDPGRVWVNAYSNDAPCYIPSERVLQEGGYEGGDAMVYYDRPTRFRPGLEGRIIKAVRQQLVPAFRAPFDPDRLQGSRPLSPQQSRATLHTKGGLTVELVAAEPLVVDPVAIDFGPDGRLWVAEMCDYPSGIDGRLKPGGRIKVLEASHGDGHYDTCKVFLDKLPFPTGIKVWRKGVLICAAPDILYAEDTTGDGKADVVRKLFSGFATHNYQARVNGLEYGLDNWVYGSGGLFGGEIHRLAGGPAVRLTNRDFRLNPDSGAIEPAAGRAQQGRVRDDWGNWFGCDNETLVRHYPLADHYLRRNAHLAPPANDVYVPDYPDSTLLYPAKRDIQLFKLSGPPRRVTSACGIGVYRDDLLGQAYTGNTFTCEPVNLLVHRLVLQPRGVTFSGRRAADETASEFLAGTDNWCRPVQVRTGPDGALWVVDMYRLVIEHPQWIPPEDLAKLDVRAGSTMGRIYRVYAKDRKPRPIVRLDKLDTAGLVAALDTPNGPQRDLVQQMLVWKQDKAAGTLLEKLASSSLRPETRLQALCTLDGLHALRAAILVPAVSDKHPGVRRHAVRLAEKLIARSPPLAEAVLKMADDPDPQVQVQLACTLGEWDDARAGRTLAALALMHHDDPFRLAAVLSSVNKSNIGAVVGGVLEARGHGGQRLTETLVGMATAFGDRAALGRVLGTLTTPREGKFAAWQFAALAGMLDALDRRRETPDKVLDRTQLKGLHTALAQAKAVFADAEASEGGRLAAVRLLGRRADNRHDDIQMLGRQLVPQNSAALQSAVVSALGRLDDERVPGELLAHWDTLSPSLRSQILDVLLSRERWLRRLLAVVEKAGVPAAQVDAARRQILLEHKDPSVRRLAAKLLAGSTNPDRKKVLDEYQPVLRMAGDRGRGKAVFAKRCATCHQLEGVGHVVGPDLASLSNKSPAVLLIAILDPNQAVDNRYLHYVAATKDGRLSNGILTAETATSITLREQDGKEQVILRGDLEELRSTGKSLMPEGLEKDLARQDLADLITYLRDSGAPPKQLPGNKPAVVRPAADGALALLATNAEVYGGDITFEPQFRNIGFWHGEQDHVVWVVRLDRAGRYDVILDYACDDGAAGNSFVLEATESALRGRVKGTGGWDKYRQSKVGTLALAPGSHRLTLRPDGQVTGALLDLRGIRLVARSHQRAKPPKAAGR
jgi:putative membrane-bound dehydrogenase-like protein